MLKLLKKTKLSKAKKESAFEIEHLAPKYQNLESKAKLLTLSSPLLSKQQIYIESLTNDTVEFHSESKLNKSSFYVLDIWYKKDFVGKAVFEISKDPASAKHKYIGKYDEELSLKMKQYISPNKLHKLATLVNH
jgi:hypothetical protein